MGYIKHDAIVVTSWSAEKLKEAHAEAMRCELFVSPIIGPVVNMYHSFFIAPDGSKEGWEESDQHDGRREAFLSWCRKQRYADKSSPIDWVAVRWGGDDADHWIESEKKDARKRKPRGE